MRCINCFNNSISETVCTACGFDISGYHCSDAHLAPGTILGGRYEIGRVIGEGGFGITYAAFDLKLESKCAVKEYFPRQFSSRDHFDTGHTNIKYITGAAQDYSEGLKRFQNEAMKLAQFDGIRSIVNVKSYISENNTGYIVMNFVEGISLKEYLHYNGEKIPADSAFTLIKSIISALIEVEKAGIIHRDISPDNIIIGNNGEPVLIDFGSAREYDTDKSMSVILKHGYAPPEQYSSAGLQGPWTDIYALCATIYKMITGIVPADAMDRLDGKEKLALPSKLGVSISSSREKALMKGLSVNAGERQTTAEELYNALYIQNDTASGKKQRIIIAAAAAVLCIAVGAVLISPWDTDSIAADEAVTAEQTESAVLITEKDPYADIASGELENGSWYITYDGILTINAEGKLAADGKIWLKYKDDIKKVVLSDNITDIGDGTFKRLTSLESVKLPDALRSIGAEAFARTALTDADIPESVEYIGEKAFEDCQGLCSVKLPAALSEINAETFYGCCALEDITLSDTLEKIGDSAFYKSGLKNITLPANKISLGENAFGCCDMLESVTLPAECVPYGIEAQFAWGESLSDIFLSEGISQETAISILNSLQVAPTSFYNVHFPDNIDIPDELVYYLPTYVTAVGKSSCPAVKKLAAMLHSVEFTDKIRPDIYLNQNTLYIDSDEYTGLKKMELYDSDSDYRTNITYDEYLYGAAEYREFLNDYVPKHFKDKGVSDISYIEELKCIRVNFFGYGNIPSLDGTTSERIPIIGSIVIDINTPGSERSTAGNMDIYFADAPASASEVKCAVLGNNVTRLEKNCFANYPEMESIFIPRTVTYISDNFFYFTKVRKIYTTPDAGGYIEEYAIQNHLTVEYTDNPLY